MRVGSGHVQILRRFWIDFFVETLEQQQHQIKTNNIVAAFFTGGPLQISFTMPKDQVSEKFTERKWFKRVNNNVNYF